MEKYYKKKNKLKIYEYENGIILPRKFVNNGPKWGLGGVCDKDNNFCDVSYYDGGWATHGGYYEWEDEEYIDEEIVYIGMFLNHWGHFLIDLTNRMWCLKELSKQGEKFKVGYIGDEEPKGNNLSFLKLLGIEEQQLLHIKKPTRFKNILVPEQSFKSCDWYTDEFTKMFDQICETVINSEYDFSKVNDLTKVYLTRRNFSKALASEFGEEFFEKLFKTNGYTSIAPETLSLEEQIYLWNNAKEIVCINGTIPLNVIFSKNDSLKLTILNKTSLIHENPYILLKIRNICPIFIDIYNEPIKNHPQYLGVGPFLLKYTDDFKSYCLKNNLKQFTSDFKINFYFGWMKVKYIWNYWGLKAKFRKFITSLIHNSLVCNRRE